ncbi:MAG: protein kinase domain-containing protein [Pseudomarimonas sp.]
MAEPDDQAATEGIEESLIPQLAGRLPFERVGPYRLLRSLGSGGMGEVYLAERIDGAFRQEVALKMVPFALADSERAARLRRERQILAQLEHPNLARLLDGGIAPDGTPFLAMEYVRGLTLVDWLISQTPAIEDRLDRFLELCAVVSYAHQRLIIHRDIKPGNILVDETGKARLLDFGIAKLLVPDTSDPTLTVAGLAPMTASYAAPEQVQGKLITTATDVYQLGLVLYWLLTGTQAQPLSRTTRPSEIERFVCVNEPVPPSRCAPGEHAVRSSGRYAADLDTIVMKALRKEPERRYASVEALAEDLRRMRARQPILARPISAFDRMRRFVERNVLATTVGLMAALALLAFGLHERHLRAAADLARAEAERSLEDRDRALSRAESVQGFLIDMFSGAQASGKGRELRVVDVLDAAESKISGRIETEPDAALALVAALAKVRLSLGQYKEAGGLLDGVLPALEIAVGEDDQRVLDLVNSRATAADYLGDYALKLELNTRRHERLLRSRGERDAATLTALFDKGASRFFLDQRALAWEEMSAAATALAEVLGADDPRALEVARYEVQFLYVDRRYEEARVRGLRVHQRAEAALGPTHPTTMSVLNMVAMSLDGLGRWRESLALHQRLQALTVEQSGPRSANLVNGHNRQGLVLMAMGDLDAAIAAFELAIDLGSPVLGPTSPNVLMAQMNLATALSLAGRHPPAAERLDFVLAERQKIFGESSTLFVMSLMQAAVLQARADNFRGAESTLRRASELLEGLSEDQLRGAKWLGDQLIAQRALVHAWEHGPANLDETFLLPMRRLQDEVGPHSGSLLSVLLNDLRALRERHGSLPPAVEAYLAAVFPASS